MPLSPQMRERLLARTKQVREQMKSFTAIPQWSLTGKNAIVQPGQSIIIRLLPRWDIANKFTLQNGKPVENPNYVEDFLFYECAEHWFNRRSDGQRLPAWCLRSFDKTAQCPLCDAADALLGSGDAEDVKAGKDLAANNRFMYNAVIGPTGKRQCGEDGLVDIRVLPVWDTIFVQIMELMTGGGEQSFSYDDIADFRQGYDLMFKRPATGSGERWDVSPAPKPSPLYLQTDAAAFQGWVGRLVDIPTAVESERKTFDEVNVLYWGDDAPEPSAAATGGNGAATTFGFETPAAAAVSAAADLDAEITAAGDDAATAGNEAVAAGATEDMFGFDMPDAASATAAPPAARPAPTRVAAPRQAAPARAQPARGSQQPPARRPPPRR